MELFKCFIPEISTGSENILRQTLKAAPLQAWNGLEAFRKLRFPDFMTTAEDGSKVVSLTHRPPLPPGNTSGTNFCWRLSRPQGHSATGRIMSLNNSHRQTLVKVIGVLIVNQRGKFPKENKKFICG